ncbi:hypothetical protein Ancab_037415 [Ancistrocladus abbreviatus]
MTTAPMASMASSSTMAAHPLLHSPPILSLSSSSSSLFNLSLKNTSLSFSLIPSGAIRHHPRQTRFIASNFALKSNSPIVVGDDLSSSPSLSTSDPDADEAELKKASKVGARVRVKVPLKVYHVPRLSEVELSGMEGELKQYVGLWKRKRISANLPYKVEFQLDNVHSRGRGPGAVKFFAHLKEDEFEFI